MSDFTKPYFDAVAQLTAPTAPFEVETVKVAGVPLRAFKNAESSLGAFLAVGRNHDANLFLQYQGEDWTVGEFYKAVDQACDWLVNQAQIQKGDPVAIAMRNRPEWLVAFVATVTIGAVAVPLNSWGKAQELIQGLEDSKAKLVFCDSDRLAFIRELNTELPAVVVNEREGPQDTSLSEIRQRPVPSEPLIADVDRHAPAILMFTSGTSGRPKGALLSHFNCCQALMNVEFIGAGTYMTNMEEMNKQLASPTLPKTLLAVPLFHISGLLSQALINLRHGRALHMMYKWSIQEALRIVKEEQITVLMGAPVMLLELLKNQAFSDEHAAHLTNVSAGGAATPELLSELYATKTGTAMSGGGWGMTETMGSGAAFTGRYFTERPSASGFPSPIVEFSFRDENGEEVPSGEPGEIWVRSSAAIQGYFSGGNESDKPIDGWMGTGDIGYISGEGLLYICGRVKDMIIRGGENIYPSEIEACLLEYPGCEEVAVVGIEHDTWGEEVGAVIKLQGSVVADADGIKSFCKSALAGYKVPEHIVFTDEPLARNTLQKLLKTAIKERYFD
ncbi:acyl--CoA ligase [Luminiphilus sp.]|jgi:acyl-CoA synthetase (AMP-forming)/AMP-acid ligase II|nr:acyl--CoA ligase [Luminiphilus sp.]MDB2313258.1 acyl--CoA ligase [Luminiphilus sp.]MDB2378155.1 acyl--CoA ligase [Luminiphilus sp.]MDB2629947.1 acyl--CoA ligase [Luminiphilus sp.]